MPLKTESQIHAIEIMLSNWLWIKNIKYSETPFVFWVKFKCLNLWIYGYNWKIIRYIKLITVSTEMGDCVGNWDQIIE